MDILLNLDPVVSALAKALRNLYNHVEADVCGLKSLGVDSETYGSLLSPVLLSKLTIRHMSHSESRDTGKGLGVGCSTGDHGM